jgi:hypothetical protein
VAGVLGLTEHVADAAGGPVPGGAGRVGRSRRWVERGVGVEPVGDGLIAQPFGDAPGVNAAHGRGLDGVADEPGLAARAGASFSAVPAAERGQVAERGEVACPDGARRVGAGVGSGVGTATEPDLDRAVAVGRLADVVALVGVGLEPVTRPLDHVEGVPLGDALLDPTGQDVGGVDARGQPGGARAGHPDGFVGGPQRHPRDLQAMLDQCAEVGAAGDAVDLLADHRGEPGPGGVLGLGQQVVDAAVARDRNRQAGRARIDPPPSG